MDKRSASTFCPVDALRLSTLQHQMPNTLAGWLTYLESLHPKTIALGLERVAQVRQRLGLQPGFPVITVGGTNGKGSVCAMLESMLHAAGYRVGLLHLAAPAALQRAGAHRKAAGERCGVVCFVRRDRAGARGYPAHLF